MALSAGARLGPYEIVAPLGAGGMGEVYKANDTRLDRTVAIKVLSATLATNTQFRARFDREARTVSRLDHPHICPLYDVGLQDGISFLVMQYLEGTTLANRLTSGPLPLNEALRIGMEIADALDRAHRAGIVHRDLKPGNIFLTKAGAKLLDFGLAKISTPAIVRSGGGSLLPTTSSNVTGPGTILGTVQYMAPEQLEGRQLDVDARTDLFAFGAVLYEMLTGKKAFQGNSPASLIAAIVKGQPVPVSVLQPTTPPALEHVLGTCLAKEPEQRFDSAHDVLLQLKWIASGRSQLGVAAPIATRSKLRERLLWALTATSVLVALLLTAIVLVRPSAREQVIRFAFDVPGNLHPSFGFGWSHLAVSPDGRRLAFVGNNSFGRNVLWLRAFNTVTAQPLPGTEGAYLPFWSPDSRSLGFFAAGKLKKINVSGGLPETLSDVGDTTGGAWNREGIILFAKHGDGLYRVSKAGDVPIRVTTLDASRHESGHQSPCFLPDDRHFLYLAVTNVLETRAIRVGSLDSSETKQVLNVATNAQYASPGYLFFVRDGLLMAQAFDAEQTKLTGEPFAVGPRIGFSYQTGLAFFSVPNAGALAYQSAAGLDGQLVWWDRNGKRLGTLGNTGDHSNPALSSDGAKVAVGRRDPATGKRNIWIYDVQRATASRFTFGSADDLNPVWSPDGSRILFTSDRNGTRDVYQKAARGVGAEKLVLESKDPKSINDMSADERYIVTDSGQVAGRTSLWVYPLVGDRKPFPFVQAPSFSARSAQLSRDARWITYSSDESGISEVYVETFPEHRGKWQISTAGGTEPMWRRDGKELFYISGETMMAVDVKGRGDQFEAGIPKALFDAQPVGTIGRNRYVVTPDGQRFLINSSVEKGESPVTVVSNWAAEVNH